MCPRINSSNKYVTSCVEGGMNTSKSHIASSNTNFSGSSSSNTESDSGWNRQAMNVGNLALDKPCCPGPVTGTSGNVVKQRDIPGFFLTESVYAAGLSLSRHRHAHAYLSFVLSGTYKEKYADRE